MMTLHVNLFVGVNVNQFIDFYVLSWSLCDFLFLEHDELLLIQVFYCCSTLINFVFCSVFLTFDDLSVCLCSIDIGFPCNCIITFP
jgi:hypothetical protein